MSRKNCIIKVAANGSLVVMGTDDVVVLGSKWKHEGKFYLVTKVGACFTTKDGVRCYGYLSGVVVGEYVSATELRKRGWTDTTIERLLGKADKFEENPVRKNGLPMRFWLMKRVFKIEKSPDFKLHTPSEDRKIGARKAVETKTKNLLAEVIGFPIKIPKLPLEVVRRNGIEAWESHNETYGEGNGASVETINRWARNWLRHEATDDYERSLSDIYGCVGTDKAYLVIRRRVDSIVQELYPELH